MCGCRVVSEGEVNVHVRGLSGVSPLLPWVCGLCLVSGTVPGHFASWSDVSITRTPLYTSCRGDLYI